MQLKILQSGKNKRKGNPSFKIENFFQFLFLSGENKWYRLKTTVTVFSYDFIWSGIWNKATSLSRLIQRQLSRARENAIGTSQFMKK